VVVVALVNVCTFQFHNHIALEVVVAMAVAVEVHTLHSECVADDDNMGRRQLAVRERTLERMVPTEGRVRKHMHLAVDAACVVGVEVGAAWLEAAHD
jgi:predicted DNA repair protein MutK